VAEVLSEEFDRPEEGMWKLWPEDWVEWEDSIEVSTEGKGGGPDKEWEGGGVRVFCSGEAL
jgi:hypothetical protein